MPRNSEVKNVEKCLESNLDCTNVEWIGEGAFGTCFSVIPSDTIVDANQVPTTKRVVVKAVRFTNDPNKEKREKFKSEVQIYHKIAHPHIVNFHGYFKFFRRKQDRSYLSEKNYLSWTDRNPAECRFLMGGIVMERLECTLDDFVKESKIEIDRDVLVSALVNQIGSALAYLHQVHSIAHGDFKDNNICVVRWPRSAQEVPQLKLIDFGNAKVDKEAFSAAESHSSCFNLDLEECEIQTLEDAESNKKLLTEKNVFLKESKQLAELTIRYAVNEPGTRSQVIGLFVNNIQINQPHLKRLLVRMFTEFDFQRISITSVLNYLKSHG